MDSLLNTQKDLILTSSVNWSSDAKNIIENDEKEFDKIHINQSTIIHTNNVNKNNLNESWGCYFAKKSPPIADLTGDLTANLTGLNAKIHQKPQFNPQNQSEFTIFENKEQEEEEREEQEEREKQEEVQQELQQKVEEKEREKESDNSKIEEEEEVEQEQMKQAEEESEELKDVVDEDVNDDDSSVMINSDEINKSIENINFDEFTQHYLLSNRDSNSTQKSNQSTNSTKSINNNNNNKLIKIVSNKIKYIQRFYQFVFDKNILLQNGKTNNDQIEKEIKSIILDYIEFEWNKNKIKTELSAITFNQNCNQCTLLLLFLNVNNNNNNNNNQWINNFLSFQSISNILHKSSNPVFTQLSST